MSRLLDLLGISGPSRHLAGLVYVAGPLATALGRAGQWHTVLALGPLVWACVWLFRPASGPIARVARWVLVGSVGVFGSMWFPVLVAAAAMVAVVVLRPRWQLVLGALVVGLAGLLAASPYLLAVEPSTLLRDGRALWPTSVVALAALGTVVLAILGSTDRHWRVAAWGGTLLVGGVAIQAMATAGVEAQSGGLLLATLGLGVAVGAAFSHETEAPLRRRAVQGLATVAGLMVLFSAAGSTVDGSWGLDVTDWGERLRFVDALSGDPSVERTLLVGPIGSLPGEVLETASYEYRLVNGAVFAFDQGWLPASRSGDRALALVVDSVSSGEVLRPGALLAPFAVRWIVVVEDAPFARAFDTQVDVREVTVAPEVRVFENTAFLPRVSAADGAWTMEDHMIRGEGRGPVRLSDNFDPGWGGSQIVWANLIPVTAGAPAFRPDAVRLSLAAASALVTLLALFGLWVGRKRA